MPTNFRTEIMAGLTTSLTACYIVVANPSILVDGGKQFNGVMTATVLVCILLTLVLGGYAKLPYLIAPGMGVNAIVAALMVKEHVSLAVALGLVFWSGVLFVLVVLTPLKTHITSFVPKNLRAAMTLALGIFLVLIGLKQLGILLEFPFKQGWPALGAPNRGWLFGIMGLATIILLWRMKKPYAIIAGMSLASFLWWIGGVGHKELFPQPFVSMPDFSTWMILDLRHSLKWSFLPFILALFFTDFFDAVATLVALSTQLEKDTKEPVGFERGLFVSALATLIPPFFGSSSGTIYLESASGLKVGGRSGIVAVVAAICFVPFLFFGPLCNAIPDCAIAPALLFIGGSFIVGALNLHIRLSEVEEWFPMGLLVIFVIVGSLAKGIFIGLGSYVVLCLLRGKTEKISLPMVLFSVLGTSFSFVFRL